MENQSTYLKAVFFLHLVLTVWALQDAHLPASYIYYNLIFLGTLLWGLQTQDSEEPIVMALAINGLSIFLDIVSICLFYPTANIEKSSPSWGFSIGMAILNVIIRPITCIVLHRIRIERSGNYSNLAIPGVGEYFGRRGPYENIDQTAPQTVDTGSPQNTVFNADKSIPPP